MPWFKVDDNFALHPKVIAAGNGAIGGWVRAGSWSAQQMTNGHIPAGVLPALGIRPRDAALLVEVGLWRAVPGGFQFHGWEQYQPTRENVESKRAKTAERVQRWRERNAVSNGVTNGVSNAAPDPTRPDPIETTPDGVVLARKRGTRLAADWLPAPELRDKMAAECPGLDFRREHDKFVDFWLSKSGANATKLDWGRTWCNWMRTAYERRPTPRPQNTGPNWDELAKRAEARDAARGQAAV